MNEYYSTFIPGLADPVEKALAETLTCKIRLTLDGLLVYESNADAAALRTLPFVTNTFKILKSFPRDARRTIPDMAAQIVKENVLAVKGVAGLVRRSGSFRLITSLANQLVAINAELMRAIEKRIIAQTGLHPNRSKPDYELWLLQRDEGYGFFSLRLSRHRAYDKVLQKGELRPELANVLCRLSDPQPQELFLDPFCGSGVIPIQRARFPTGLIFASDSDQKKIDLLKQRVKESGLNKKIVVRRENALDLDRYEAGAIHKIVTDPPWGHFEETSLPLPEFYDRMMAEFVRILKPDGRLVIVTAQTAALEANMQKMGAKLRLEKKYNILLSGKKASVYVMTRMAEGG